MLVKSDKVVVVCATHRSAEAEKDPSGMSMVSELMVGGAARAVRCCSSDAGHVPRNSTSMLLTVALAMRRESVRVVDAVVVASKNAEMLDRDGGMSASAQSGRLPANSSERMFGGRLRGMMVARSSSEKSALSCDGSPTGDGSTRSMQILRVAGFVQRSRRF